MAALHSDKRPVLVLRRAPRSKTRAILQFGPLTIPAAIGRSGLTSRKREGDGATPIACMALLGGHMRRDRGPLPLSPLKLSAIRRRDLWCDAPFHPCYNRPVKAPFASNHEEMMREDGLYDICIVLDWNIRMRRQGAGSAIFFHLIRPGYEPTAGCVAIARRDMTRLLPHLRRGLHLRVVA